ncbi:MAG: DUF3341 domain-containing protein [Deltaproteobacteria bacterium]|nr:DUF3341 domain-containing protein [Deltaproteobacteria bacterium]
MSNSILGLFEHVDVLLKAAGRVKRSGCDVTIISPIPLGHEIEHAFGQKKKNLVRYFTGFGAAAGFFSGAAFALATAALYVLPRGGRPVFSAVPTLLVAFETTILFGVLMTLIGFVFLSWRVSFRNKGFHPNIAVDKFGLLVSGIREDLWSEVERILREHGAHEIQNIKD